MRQSFVHGAHDLLIRRHHFRRVEARQARVLSHDEARRIASNIAKLPELLDRQVRQVEPMPNDLNEIKHDGYRSSRAWDGRRARLFSRRGHDTGPSGFRVSERRWRPCKRNRRQSNGEAFVCCPKTGLSLFDRLHSGRYDREVMLYASTCLNGTAADLRTLPLAHAHSASICRATGRLPRTSSQLKRLRGCGLGSRSRTHRRGSRTLSPSGPCCTNSLGDRWRFDGRLCSHWSSVRGSAHDRASTAGGGCDR